MKDTLERNNDKDTKNDDTDIQGFINVSDTGFSSPASFTSPKKVMIQPYSSHLSSPSSLSALAELTGISSPLSDGLSQLLTSGEVMLDDKTQAFNDYNEASREQTEELEGSNINNQLEPISSSEDSNREDKRDVIDGTVRGTLDKTKSERIRDLLDDVQKEQRAIKPVQSSPSFPVATTSKEGEPHSNDALNLSLKSSFTCVSKESTMLSMVSSLNTSVSSIVTSPLLSPISSVQSPTQRVRDEDDASGKARLLSEFQQARDQIAVPTEEKAHASSLDETKESIDFSNDFEEESDGESKVRDSKHAVSELSPSALENTPDYPVPKENAIIERPSGGVTNFLKGPMKTIAADRVSKDHSTSMKALSRDDSIRKTALAGTACSEKDMASDDLGSGASLDMTELIQQSTSLQKDSGPLIGEYASESKSSCDPLPGQTLDSEQQEQKQPTVSSKTDAPQPGVFCQRLRKRQEKGKLCDDSDSTALLLRLKQAEASNGRLEQQIAEKEVVLKKVRNDYTSLEFEKEQALTKVAKLESSSTILVLLEDIRGSLKRLRVTGKLDKLNDGKAVLERTLDVAREVEEQDRLIKGYQKENERLLSECKVQQARCSDLQQLLEREKHSSPKHIHIASTPSSVKASWLKEKLQLEACITHLKDDLAETDAKVRKAQRDTVTEEVESLKKQLDDTIRSEAHLRQQVDSYAEAQVDLQNDQKLHDKYKSQLVCLSASKQKRVGSDVNRGKVKKLEAEVQRLKEQLQCQKRVSSSKGKTTDSVSELIRSVTSGSMNPLVDTNKIIAGKDQLILSLKTNLGSLEDKFKSRTRSLRQEHEKLKVRYKDLASRNDESTDTVLGSSLANLSSKRMMKEQIDKMRDFYRRKIGQLVTKFDKSKLNHLPVTSTSLKQEVVELRAEVSILQAENEELRTLWKNLFNLRSKESLSRIETGKKRNLKVLSHSTKKKSASRMKADTFGSTSTLDPLQQELLELRDRLDEQYEENAQLKAGLKHQTHSSSPCKANESVGSSMKQVQEAALIAKLKAKLQKASDRCRHLERQVSLQDHTLDSKTARRGVGPVKEQQAIYQKALTEMEADIRKLMKENHALSKLVEELKVENRMIKFKAEQGIFRERQKAKGSHSALLECENVKHQLAALKASHDRREKELAHFIRVKDSMVQDDTVNLALTNHSPRFTPEVTPDAPERSPHAPAEKISVDSAVDKQLALVAVNEERTTLGAGNGEIYKVRAELRDILGELKTLQDSVIEHQSG